MIMIGITLTESPEGPDLLNRAYSVDNTGKHEKLSEGPVNDCSRRTLGANVVAIVEL